MKNTGGTAFPFLELDGSGMAHHQHEGMTLRDYFAAKAMQTMLHDALEYDTTDNEIAITAYKMADEMLKARQE
jgi:hypothetical protein